MSGARNVRGGLVLLAFGIGAGLAMSLYAFDPLVPVPAGLARYDDLPRRLLRLAHIAAVMLPLLNVVLGPWLDRLALAPRAVAAASWLLLAGAVTLPASLALEALAPAARAWHPAALPALLFAGGVAVVALGACRTDFREEAAHAARPSRAHDEDDRGASLQEAAGRA